MTVQLPKVVITGANGFVGRALSIEAVARGLAVKGVTRTICKLPTGVKNVVIGSFEDANLWLKAFAGCDVVVHLAARVHVMQETYADGLSEFRRVNVMGTLSLARCAAVAGVKRFVFVSSIKVNGELTQDGEPMRADDPPIPSSAYGVSKWEAELGLREIALNTGMEVVVIRPPLVYGPGVRANFATMMHVLRRGVPVPLGAIRNKRSFVALDNLVDLIITCLFHPGAANETFLVSDGEDVSTTELLRRMGQALGRPARLLPLPGKALKLAAALIGKQDVLQRLVGSLQVDISKTRILLGWAPPITLDEGLRRAAAGMEL